MGGYVTLAFAEQWPEQLKGFGLIHSTAFADSEEKKAARRKSIAFIQENGTEAFLQATLPNLFGTRFQQQHPEAIQQLLQWGAAFKPEALIGYYEAMLQRPDRSAVLQQAKVPVLFFIGAEDKAVPPADAVLQSSYPEVAVVKKVEHIAHMGMWEAPDALNQLLLQYLQLVG
jgi:pimeloyl-ACP methyl ester carboxylesterase